MMSHSEQQMPAAVQALEQESAEAQPAPQRLLSIVTPCFNEALNVRALYEQTRAVAQSLAGWQYEHIFIDNASTDDTVPILKDIAASDPNVKIIVNVRNFGQLRSPHHAILQAHGDVVVLMTADLQDPPMLIKEFIARWQSGYKVVLGIKNTSAESPALFAIRKFYYRLANRLSSVRLYENATGFGLYDRQVVETLRQVDDPQPYFRGLIAELGFDASQVTFHQPQRERGITKNNFFTLFDIAMLGITSHSKVPLRLATLLGVACSALFFLTGVGYLIAKLAFWDQFSLGTAPLIIVMCLFASVQLFFIGVLGEYIGAIHTQVLKRPLVVEKERVNFGDD